jgi:hypothetical protein
MLTMIAINRDGVRILYRVGHAVRDYRHGEKATALREVRGTLPLFRQIRHMERLARLLPHHAVRGRSHRQCALKPRSAAIIRLRTASRS